MKKISEGNKGIQALAKENPALVEDKFGYDVPGYFMGGMPGVDEAVDDAQEDLDKQNKCHKVLEEAVCQVVWVVYTKEIL